jgi:hypothetical protein
MFKFRRTNAGRIHTKSVGIRNFDLVNIKKLECIEWFINILYCSAEKYIYLNKSLVRLIISMMSQ